MIDYGASAMKTNKTRLSVCLRVLVVSHFIALNDVLTKGNFVL